MITINYVDSGLGNRFDDHIELNKNLLKPEYQQIHDIILNHELSHSDKAFTIKDLVLDLGESEINRLDLFKFMIKHPKSFTQLLPVYWCKKHGFVYDINLILIYLSMFSLFSISLYLAI